MTRLLAWLASFRPEPIGADLRERLRGSAGAFLGLHPEDLDDILEHQSELLDIGRDDLLALFNEMERRAEVRKGRKLKTAAE